MVDTAEARTTGVAGQMSAMCRQGFCQLSASFQPAQNMASGRGLPFALCHSTHSAHSACHSAQPQSFLPATLRTTITERRRRRSGSTGRSSWLRGSWSPSRGASRRGLPRLASACGIRASGDAWRGGRRATQGPTLSMCGGTSSSRSCGGMRVTRAQCSPAQVQLWLQLRTQCVQCSRAPRGSRRSDPLHTGCGPVACAFTLRALRAERAPGSWGRTCGCPARACSPGWAGSMTTVISSSSTGAACVTGAWRASADGDRAGAGAAALLAACNRDQPIVSSRGLRMVQVEALAQCHARHRRGADRCRIDGPLRRQPAC